MEQFEGRVAVITGAGSGIGLAVSRAFGKAGAKVVMADVIEERLTESAAALTDEGLTVHPVVTDVADFDAVQRLADEAYDRFGEVHVVHLNAGVGVPAFYSDTPPELWNQIIGVNLFGVVWGILAFLPRMSASDIDAGIIVATSSGAGAEGTNCMTPGYSATKIAVLSLMESLFGTLRDQKSKIRAAVLMPPLTDTKLAGDFPGAMQFVEDLVKNQQGIPTALVGPEPVAQMLLDGIRTNRFFIRVDTQRDKQFFGGSQPVEQFAWAEQMIRGRAEAMLSDGDPSSYAY
ncbi:SDR family NAD(P)-dependent oxidoreductase [Mycobacterium sp. 94-17]|uniref:SDR family NAD(P)-dependent oxidoreductase n=1 Tax=Mycobacterium sp. 94-17 TaxID=2986147 RepID=UPI002D1F7E21|nr:SDR family NAD(P)-dependent oxidoreductase [Mycobacterium sp. 94-17]MEB4209772.1 SDR family NAD(P)-dependent oxidoreductase [Mycobacterium sp. 94-17]